MVTKRRRASGDLSATLKNKKEREKKKKPATAASELRPGLL